MFGKLSFCWIEFNHRSFFSILFSEPNPILVTYISTLICTIDGAFIYSLLVRNNLKGTKYCPLESVKQKSYIPCFDVCKWVWNWRTKAAMDAMCGRATFTEAEPSQGQLRTVTGPCWNWPGREANRWPWVTALNGPFWKMEIPWS